MPLSKETKHYETIKVQNHIFFKYLKKITLFLLDKG